VYELIWSEDVEASLPVVETPAPPSAGPAPFAPGEAAAYDVHWIGGPAAFPAGRATLTVAAPTAPLPEGAVGGAPAYTFVVTAETAPWVSRFFEARDRFETVADRALLPLVHERHLVEGRRRVDLTVTFDHAERIVRRRQAGDEPLALRMPAWSRDALTAFYYVRTLEWSDMPVVLPLSDAGRASTLTVDHGGIEEIDHEGRRVRARKLVPSLSRQARVRAPLQMTAWVSLDDRRIPLRVLVVGAFGRVRAELVDYRLP
jgi:hypothetical protein